MPTLWIVIAVVVTVLLVVGWLYDRKFGFHADRMPSAERRAAAEAHAWNTQHGIGGGEGHS
jgi:hypothetical protein